LEEEEKKGTEKTVLWGSFQKRFRRGSARLRLSWFKEKRDHPHREEGPGGKKNKEPPEDNQKKSLSGRKKKDDRTIMHERKPASLFLRRKRETEGRKSREAVQRKTLKRRKTNSGSIGKS